MNSSLLSKHVQVDQYGDYRLTRAIRPGPDLTVVPRQGFRIGSYRDPQKNLKVPVLAASVSAEQLFDVFLGLLRPLGSMADIVLETSHHSHGGKHRDLFREGMELPILTSNLCDFEELLVDDGCTGVAVIANQSPMEVQFDEHKLLVVYAHDLEPFERVLWQAGVERDDDLKLITEGEHLHCTHPRFVDEFEQLCYRLGVGSAAERVSW